MENTKVISCRVPFSDYIELLKKVNDKGSNVSDYLLSKVYCEPDSEKEKIQNLEMDCTQKLEEIAELQTQIEDLQSELSSQESLIIELQAKEKKQAQQLARALQDCQNKDNLINNKSADYQQLIERLKQEKNEITSQMEDLEQNLQNEIQRLTETIAEKNKLITELKKDCRQYTTELGELNEKISAKDYRKSQEISRLQAEYEAEKDKLKKEYKSDFDRLKQAENEYKAKIKTLVMDIVDNFPLNTWSSVGKIKESLKAEISQKIAI